MINILINYKIKSNLIFTDFSNTKVINKSQKKTKPQTYKTLIEQKAKMKYQLKPP